MPPQCSKQPMIPNLDQRREIQRRVAATAEFLRLPFRARTWRGQAGNWLGAGVGSSIDFQDHRPYLPGDDPRHIDWRAYARTGNYTMKLYREEVSPSVDLVLDVSASMFFDTAKSARVMELFYFCIQSARGNGASLHCFVAMGGNVRLVPLEQALAGDDFFQTDATGVPNLAPVPWRQGSLRVLVSDLLFAGTPDAMLAALGSGKGRGLIFAPFCADESAPDWNGNIELTDCETRRQRVQRVSPDLLARYTQAYAWHFGLWRERARKHAVAVARVASEPAFSDALRTEAMPAGAVEFC